MSKWNVFISKKSEDFAFAKQVYDMLVANGSKVFLSEISIPEENRADYQETVEQAIDQCEHMVVVASSHENIVSPWVKEEWRIFLSDLRCGRKTGNIVTVLAGGMTVDDLPSGLRIRQSLRLDSHGLSELLHYVKSKAAPQDASPVTTPATQPAPTSECPRAAAEARPNHADEASAQHAGAAPAQHRAGPAETSAPDETCLGSKGTKPLGRRRFAVYGIAASVCVAVLLAALFLKDTGSRLQGHTEKPKEAAQALPDAKQGGTPQAGDENSVTVEAIGRIALLDDTSSGKKKAPQKFTTPLIYAACIAQGLEELAPLISGSGTKATSVGTVGNWRFSSLLKSESTNSGDKLTIDRGTMVSVIENQQANLILTTKGHFGLTEDPDYDITMSVNGQLVSIHEFVPDAMQSTINSLFPTWNEYNANPDAPVDFFGVKLSDFSVDESGNYSIKLTFTYDKRDLRLSR
ncbi:MAG TPA: TIR domain-containing protein [Solidesulfovibrio sp.]|nr:TIR domain-containing protein [Solidesulfovibrio sp.]